jgi:hypothetical protein
MAKYIQRTLDWISRFVTAKAVLAWLIGLPLVGGVVVAVIALMQEMTWAGRIVAVLMAMAALAFLVLVVAIVAHVLENRKETKEDSTGVRDGRPGTIAVRYVIGLNEQNASHAKALEARTRELEQEKAQLETWLASARANTVGLNDTVTELIAELQKSLKDSRHDWELIEEYFAGWMEAEERFKAAMWTVGNMLTVLYGPESGTDVDRLKGTIKAIRYGHQFYETFDFFLRASESLRFTPESAERFRAIRLTGVAGQGSVNVPTPSTSDSAAPDPLEGGS